MFSVWNEPAIMSHTWYQTRTNSPVSLVVSTDRATRVGCSSFCPCGQRRKIAGYRSISVFQRALGTQAACGTLELARPSSPCASLPFPRLTRPSRLMEIIGDASCSLLDSHTTLTRPERSGFSLAVLINVQIGSMTLLSF